MTVRCTILCENSVPSQFGLTGDMASPVTWRPRAAQLQARLGERFCFGSVGTVLEA